MDWDKFINQIVDLGITAAKRDYKRPDQKPLLDGSIAGFQACRNKSVVDLPKILEDAAAAREVSLNGSTTGILFAKGYYNEVEWVCNVASAALYNQQLPVIIQPTVRAMQTAAQILGVKDNA